MTADIEIDSTRLPRKVNDCFKVAKRYVPPRLVFDEFWSEGEMALFFGAAGTGKSVLAMQIAEAIARGRAMDGFDMQLARQKVLYVDLVLSDAQIETRYTFRDAKSGRVRQYKFSENLYRDCPPSSDGLCKWLRLMVAKNGFRIVVIDDLSAIRQTYDGTRETLKLLRELKQVKDELGLSLLVLSSAREPGRGGLVGEADMQRSRVLCDAADSVFAVGLNPSHACDRYLVQTRSRNSVIRWRHGNAPACRMNRSKDGFLSFKFDGRFDPELDEDLRQLICDIKWQHDAGDTFRMIGDDLGISKSKAARLYHQWKPEMMRHEDTAIDDMDEDDVFASDVAVEDEHQESLDAELEIPPGSARTALEKEPIANAYEEWDVPSSEAPERHDPSGQRQTRLTPDFEPLAHLKRDLDKNDREIFVETADERGTPQIWYLPDSKGKFTRYRRSGGNLIGQTVDGPMVPFNSS